MTVTAIVPSMPLPALAPRHAPDAARRARCRFSAKLLVLTPKKFGSAAERDAALLAALAE